jgi:hypothetical protein
MPSCAIWVRRRSWSGANSKLVQACVLRLHPPMSATAVRHLDMDRQRPRYARPGPWRCIGVVNS